MATLSLATPEQHGDEYRTTLDGRDYELAWSWNQRSSRWWLRLSSSEGHIAYIPAVTGFPLLKSVSGTARPPGELLVLDPTGEAREPGLRNFADFAFVYVEEE